MLATLGQLQEHFEEVLGLKWDVPDDLKELVTKIIKTCGPFLLPAAQRQNTLYSLINSKFRLNHAGLQTFLDEAASQKVFLNYRDKLNLLEFFDSNDADAFEKWLEARELCRFNLGTLFKPITIDETKRALQVQLERPVVSRSDARQCSVAERRQAILRSLFGGYVFRSFPSRIMHSYFNRESVDSYVPDFFEHLKLHHASILHRECALVFLLLDPTVAGKSSYESFLNAVFDFIRRAYDRLSNHCYFAVLVKPFSEDDEDIQWRLFSDIILFAEKHREVALSTGYFRPHNIAQVTNNYIPGLNIAKAKFEIANEGFFFRDCIVLPHDGFKGRTSSVPLDLLLLFEKNERDETLIPCPACRSSNVTSNSYPTLGVKSWECTNPICPERSAFDRGNRYSLASLIKQKAINSVFDQIPTWSLKKWKLDVVADTDDEAVKDMLVRHFSLHDDTVLFANVEHTKSELHGRRVLYESFNNDSGDGVYRAFQNSSFFNRFLVTRESNSHNHQNEMPFGLHHIRIIQGDCFDVLTRFDDDTFHGAVTSPPYYNARSYKVWPNIYCYLYDVFNVARQVYRTLKPGGVFLFNIFDYFDNENILVSSTMGKKRMILGAYVINMFRRVGFKLDGNVVWYKGEIEGKRNFNQGNRSPYYQLPFNCWEHILVFSKPGNSNIQDYEFPSVLQAKPVIKMIRGQNVLGHTAPFPAAVPELLLNQMMPGDQVVDPFAGSMTTGRVALKYGLACVCIELHEEYCELGRRLLKGENSRFLFDSEANAFSPRLQSVLPITSDEAQD